MGTTGTTALCSSKMPCDIVPLDMTWMATYSPFSAGPVCCKVLAMSGASSHSSLLIFMDIKFTCSVENQIGFGDL